jgi:hypothetical protein
MKKITMATVKSFIKKNSDSLHILRKTHFDGMVDGCTSSGQSAFNRTLPTDMSYENTLGIQGAWFVGGSRNHLQQYDDKGFTGISVYNCCGSFVLAVPKEVTP